MDEGKELLTALVLAVEGNNTELINKYKYENLLYGFSLISIVSNFIALTDYGINFDFGFEVIKKGTKLYRIRKIEPNVDLNDSSQWSFNPKRTKNRANVEGEIALYLGTTETVCLLETHIKEGESYALGEYEVKEDIMLGGFIRSEDKDKMSWVKAAIVLNAFLIAPARCDKNKELFELLDNAFEGLTLDQIKVKDIDNPNLPLKFAVVNKRNKFYDLTNRLLIPIKEKYKEGISYSSCYIPLGTVGIRCTDRNIVLYKEGIKKIQFVRSKLKINDKKFTDVKMMKILIDTFTNLKK